MTIFTNTRTVYILISIFLILLLMVFGFLSCSSMGPLSYNNDESPSQMISQGEAPGGDVEYTAEDEDTEPSTPSPEGKDALFDRSADDKVFFIEYRLERERVRGEQLELLQGIVDDGASDSEIRKNAQKKLVQMTDSMEQELQLESLIKAKGYDEAALFLRRDSANVILGRENIQEEDIIIIADMVSRITGCDLDKVVVIPKNGNM